MAHVFATLSVTLMLIVLTLVFYVLVSRLYAFIYRWMRETILKAAAKRRALLLLSDQCLCIHSTELLCFP